MAQSAHRTQRDRRRRDPVGIQIPPGGAAIKAEIIGGPTATVILTFTSPVLEAEITQIEAVGPGIFGNSIISGIGTVQLTILMDGTVQDAEELLVNNGPGWSYGPNVLPMTSRLFIKDII
jgi:hypothetical protein